MTEKSVDQIIGEVKAAGKSASLDKSDEQIEYLKTRVVNTTYEDQKWNVKGDLYTVCKITLDNGMVFKGACERLKCYTPEQIEYFSLRSALYDAKFLFQKIKIEIDFQKNKERTC